jgi:hypothetical protein
MINYTIFTKDCEQFFHNLTLSVIVSNDTSTTKSINKIEINRQKYGKN